MSIIDDLKEMVGLHATNLETRLGGIENQLSRVAASSDAMAEKLRYESAIRRYEIPATAPLWSEGGAEPLFTVPPGMFVKLTLWGFSAGTADRVILMLDNHDSIVSTAPETGVNRVEAVPIGELYIPEKHTLLAANNAVKQATQLVFHFMEYEKGADGVTMTGSGG